MAKSVESIAVHRRAADALVHLRLPGRDVCPHRLELAIERLPLKHAVDHELDHLRGGGRDGGGCHRVTAGGGQETRSTRLRMPLSVVRTGPNGTKISVTDCESVGTGSPQSCRDRIATRTQRRARFSVLDRRRVRELPHHCQQPIEYHTLFTSRLDPSPRLCRIERCLHLVRTPLRVLVRACADCRSGTSALPRGSARRFAPLFPTDPRARDPSRGSRARPGEAR